MIAKPLDRERPLRIALVGNPNTGKSCIFNNITNQNQRVGNYSGVTVDIASTKFRYQNVHIEIVDLPGTYSLSSTSPDEAMVETFLLESPPDIIVNIIDATNLERNLYLTTQLAELEIPTLLVLNMIDQLENEKRAINIKHLSELLQTPIVTTVGNRNKGTTALLDAILAISQLSKPPIPRKVHFSNDIEMDVQKVVQLVAEQGVALPFPARWFAIKLMEYDSTFLPRWIKEEKVLAKFQEIQQKIDQHLLHLFNESTSAILTEQRYGFVSGTRLEVLTAKPEKRYEISDKIDNVLTNKILGIPIFFFFIYCLFQVTFWLGEYPMNGLETLFRWLADVIRANTPEGWFQSLFIEAVLGGVGGVLVFLPLIIILFLGISILEDSGYMARGAFIVDHFMHRVGLHGKSFIPMIIGFGCAIPAILSTRMLENRKERFITLLIIPLMSCGARLPIYTLLIGAFFPLQYSGVVLFSIYMIGIILALILAKIFSTMMFKKEDSSFVMELPPYRIPTLRSLLVHSMVRSWHYLKKAGTIILTFSILVWLCSNIQISFHYTLDYPTILTEKETTLQELDHQTRTLLSLEHIEDIYRLSPYKEVTGSIQQCDTDLEHAISKHNLSPDDPLYRYAIQKRQQELDQIATQYPEQYAIIYSYLEKKAIQVAEVRNLKSQYQIESFSQSIAGYIGYGLSVLLTPTGLGEWKLGLALFSGFAAKEIIVSTLGTLYSVGEDVTEESVTLRTKLQEDPFLNPLVAFIFMVFVLLYIPCLATVATIKQETNSWFWAAFTFVYMFVLAGLVTTLIYQTGTFIQSLL